MALEKISVIGLGYIGLPTAAAIAMQRKHVLGVDVNSEVVDTINRGEIHIIEPELDVAVQASVSRGFLKAYNEVQSADAFLIAVPTPLDESKQPDLKYVEAAARAVARVLNQGNLVILESTSPVGTTEKLCGWMREEREDLTFPDQDGIDSDIRVAYCPERVLPGQVMFELISNDRIVGGVSEKCTSSAKELYNIFVKAECIGTDSKTAELCKLTENALRDVNIGFANELSLICDEIGINVWELINLANRHPRINILQPGPGVGGHCIAVDPWFIISRFQDKAKIMRSARDVNDHKPRWVIEKIDAAVAEFVNNRSGQVNRKPVIVCLGLAFKANIDDLRESPALWITDSLNHKYPGQVLAVEPNINEDKSSKLGLQIVNLEQGIESADILVVLVDHHQFKEVKAEKLNNKIVIDTKGIWGA